VKTENYELKPHALIQIPDAQIRKLGAQKSGKFLSRLRNLQTFQSGMPVDAPLVYESSEYGNITGGTGQDLAEQVVDILTKKLHLTARP
jgi:hypothetical protein